MNLKGIGGQISLLVVGVSMLIVLICCTIEFFQLKTVFADSKLKAAVNISRSIVHNFTERATSGEFTKEESYKRALSVIKGVRFNGSNFVMIMSDDGKMLVHPTIEPGTNVMDIKDQTGLAFYKSMIDTQKTAPDGFGWTDFYYPDASTGQIVKRTAVSSAVPEWGLVIAASIPETELISAAFNDIKFPLAAATGSTVLIVIFVMATFVRSLIAKLDNVTSGLKHSIDSVSGSSVSLNDASQKLAEGSSEQAASIQEIVATIEESVSMIERTYENAGYSAKLASRSKEVATECHHGMDTLMEAINEIGVSSEEISKIAKVIDEIAFQINVLALNAAVEAQRAGDAGKGFAVVAEEVRNLAQRTAESVQNTSTLVSKNVETYRRTASVAERVYKSIAEIEDGSIKVNDLVNEVSSATHEQKIGIEQIHAAISQIEQVLQVTSRTAGDTSTNSQELSGETEVLAELAQDLTSFVYGAK